MHLILSYATGRRSEGILLAAGPGRMRIVVRRLNETIELHQEEGKWLSDDGEPVEIESWVSDGCTGIADLLSRFVPRTHTARN